MPMCAFIPIAALPLSLPLHVKRTGILKRAQYHCLIKDSLTWVEHQHGFRRGKGIVCFCDKRNFLSIIAALCLRASDQVRFGVSVPSGMF